MNQNISSRIQYLFPDKTIHIKKKYKSKKNNVFLITIDNNPKIVKLFNTNNKEGMEREIHMLRTIPSPFHIPRLYQVNIDDKLLIMEYIVGENLCDVINDCSISKEKKKSNIRSLAKWFASFHLTLKKDYDYYIKGDSHIRNFIILEHDICGVDFEETRIGNLSEDIAECCVSILLTNKIFTHEKFLWCKELIQTYQQQVTWPLDDLEPIFYHTIERVITRRKKSNELYEIYMKNKKKIQQIILPQ